MNRGTTPIRARFAESRARVRPWAGAIAAVTLLGACAGTPGDGPTPALMERVDDRTAVHVIALAEPLVFSSARGRPGMPEDLALGPVQLNRQGERTYFLWVNLLSAEPLGGPPRLRLVDGDEMLAEVALTVPENSVPVSRPPYERIAAWALEAWYPIAPDDLARLAGRSGLAVEMQGRGGWVRFEPWDRDLAGLRDFVDTQLGGAGRTQVAER